MKKRLMDRFDPVFVGYNAVLLVIIAIITLFVSFFSLGSKEQIEYTVKSNPGKYFVTRFVFNFVSLVFLLFIVSGINYLYMRMARQINFKVVYRIALYELIGLSIASIVFILIGILRVY